MAKSSGFDSESVREDEREIETRAAYAGKGMDDDTSGEEGEYMMPDVTEDTSERVVQRVANAARSYNQKGESDKENEAGEGTGTEVY
jgi:hypothetical protein